MSIGLSPSGLLYITILLPKLSSKFVYYHIHF